MTSLTDKQRAALDTIKGGGGIRYHCSPGADKGGYFFETENNHSDLDGRTFNGLEMRGFVVWDGDRYEISAAGRNALVELEPEK